MMDRNPQDERKANEEEGGGSEMAFDIPDYSSNRTEVAEEFYPFRRELPNG